MGVERGGANGLPIAYIGISMLSDQIAQFRYALPLETGSEFERESEA